MGKEIRITFLADEKLARAIDRMAARLGVNRSDFIRHAVIKAMKEYEKIGSDLYVMNKKTLELLKRQIRNELIDEVTTEAFKYVLEALDNFKVPSKTFDKIVEKAWQKLPEEVKK